MPSRTKNDPLLSRLLLLLATIKIARIVARRDPASAPAPQVALEVWHECEDCTVRVAGIMAGHGHDEEPWGPYAAALADLDEETEEY